LCFSTVLAHWWLQPPQELCYLEEVL
jgi:hypothetical protein